MDVKPTDVASEIRTQAVPRTQASPKSWLDKLEKRYKTLKKEWLEDADRVQAIYECKDKQKYPFNILYSNTETVLPALYNSTPRPEVARRYTTLDQASKAIDSAVAATAERTLEYLADTNHAEYETYSGTIKEAVRAFLVPGLGQARVKYHEEEGYQTVCFEPVAHDRFLWAYARRWSAVPWVAFGHDMLKEEFEENFPEFVQSKEYKDFDWEALEKEEKDDDKGDEMHARAGLLVWELWDYPSKKVLYVCNRFRDSFVHTEGYPERMTGRFPCPKPLMFAKKQKCQAPIPAYTFYEQQAEELNLISRRIIRVVKALKVRGFYNGSFGGDLNSLLNEDDENILVPTEEATMQDGIDKYIWMMPIDMLVATLQNLIVAREQCKQTIYEIMGIGDILRGASNPNETAKAQEIKNNWGGLRIKKAQRDVQDFCLELFRIAFEFTASYFSPATYAAITKLPFLFQGQVQQIQQQMQAFQQQQAQQQEQYQMMAQQAQQMGQQPPPPPPEQPPPVPQEMLVRSQMPSWEQVVQTIQSTFERSYRIDIETNSTVDLEATEDKQDIADFMNAFGQMTAGLAPMLESKTMPFEAAKLIMGETFRRFRFGRRVQEALDMMQEPQQPQADPKEIEKQVTQQLEGKFKTEMAQKDLKHQEDKLGWTQEKVKLEGRITQLEVKGEQQKNSHLIEKNTIKQDYQGKMQLQQQQSQQKLQDKDTQLQEANVKGMMDQYAAGAQQLQQQIKMLEQRMTEMAQMEQRDEAEESAAQQRHEQLLQALMQNQQQMAEAIQQLLKAQRATRETQLLVGPDGSKRSVSRMLEE